MVVIVVLLVVIGLLVAFAAGMRAGWLRDRAEWKRQLASAAASPVVIVKRAPDGTIELWRGLANSGEPSRLIAEYEARDGVMYSDLKDALNGRE